MARPIVYNEDVLKEVFKELKEYRTMVGESSSKMVNDFSGLTSLGYLSNTVGDIKKGFDSIENFQEDDIFGRNTDDVFGADRDTARDLEAMEIPQHFVANESMDIKTYNNKILEKIDGKSIKEGGDAKEGTYDDETTVAAENIKDINANSNVKDSSYDETTIIGKSVLGSIDPEEEKKKEEKTDDAIAASLNNLGINNYMNVSPEETEKEV